MTAVPFVVIIVFKNNYVLHSVNIIISRCNVEVATILFVDSMDLASKQEGNGHNNSLHP